MAAFTITKKIGSGQVFTTLQGFEDGAPANYTTAEKSAAGTFAVAAFVQGETLSFVGSGAAGKFLDTDSTGVGNGTYIAYGLTSGNPAASDVVTGATSGATCVLSSGTPTNVGCVWKGTINASTDVFSSASALLSVSGGTVASDAYLELTTAAGAAFNDNANVQTNALRYNSSNGCAISLTGTYATCVSISQNYTRLSNLQIQATAANGVTVAVTGVNCDINKCIIEGARTQYVLSMFDTNTIRNSLIVSRVSSAALIATLKSSVSAINCTFAVPSDKTAATNAVATQYGNSTFENCAFFGVSGVDSGTSHVFTTCYTNVGSPPSGCSTATYNTSQFVNITDSTRDYRIPSGSALIGAGTTDSTNSPVDIANTTRVAPWDVGCWQYVSAAAGQVKKIDGLAIASVKAILGTVKSSLKKWDGLTL